MPQHKLLRRRAAQPCRVLLAAMLMLAGLHGLATAAEQPDEDATKLEPDQLVEQVLENNAGLDALRAAVDAAEARIVPAGALPDPQLSAAVAPETIGGFETPSGLDRNVNLRVEISQELPWPGKLGLRADAAAHEAEAAGEGVAALRLRLAMLTRSAYAEWAYVHRALEINTANQELVNELRRIAETRYAAGLTGQQDVLHAEVELQHLKHMAIELRRLKRSVRAKINALLNRRADMELALSSHLPQPQALPDYSSLRNAALSTHPELAQIDKRLAANADREALAEKAFYPDFKLFSGYSSLWDADEKRWLVGAGINLPIYRDKRRAAVDEAKANSIRLQAELTDGRAQLLSQLEQAHAAVEEAEHEIALYEGELIPRTRENLSAARSEYGAGAGSFLDVITAEQLQLNAELELERARANYYVACAELERWAGGELPTTGP